MILKEEEYLEHYGILRKSGRYPWGSGPGSETTVKRSQSFLDMVEGLRKEGLSNKEIARGYKMTTTELRAASSIATNELRQQKINQAVKLRDRGWGYTAIGERMDVNESTVRSLLKSHEQRKVDSLQATADMLRKQVDEKGVIDIGVGVERGLPLGEDLHSNIGISQTKLSTAAAMLKEYGYKVHTVPVPQIGVPGNFTRQRVLAKGDIPWKDIVKDPGLIKSIQAQSKDNGQTYEVFQTPIHVSSKRVGINYAEDGGSKTDGVIYVRPGKEDITLGKNNYAQVRISVDGTHYLKGMAVYKDDLPLGTDLLFNTNKSRVGNTKFDVMKAQKDDPDNPFGATVSQLKDDHGKVKSAMNMVNEEGQWDKWSKSLPSQMLSKQKPEVAKSQLDITYDRRRKEYEAISQLTNPAVKRRLLTDFADSTDSAAVHLKAAAMPRQATKAILPITSMTPNEVYAPSFKNGERVALVRFPHGGTFEIPLVTVNNRNPEARKTLGTAAKDAIGIHHTVAERLSGADFDGDSVLVIPNPKGSIKNTPPLEGLKGFDPRAQYRAYDGMKTVDGGNWSESRKEVVYPKDPKTGRVKAPNKSNMQHQMGDISNLITDMTVQGAPSDKLARAVRHSMVIIDSEKHVLDYKSSAKDNGIPSLKEEYQGGKKRGASTLLSRAGGEVRIPKRRARYAQEGGPIDPKTGRKMFVETGETYKDKKGRLVVAKEKHQRLAVTDDAHELVSRVNTQIENIYADHSNSLKSLANQARKDSLSVGKTPVQASAKRVYANEVDSLKAKLNVALKNAPLERQAQAIANSQVAAIKRANPNLDKDDEKKIKNQRLAEARVRTGAKKNRVDITKEEWNAIQAGAISTNQLKQILDNSDMEKVRKLAMPRQALVMTSAKRARAERMLADGFSQADVADALGVALSTLKATLYE